mmetsp:Transcript_19763/g.48502  ORF Transcript_19763/g.48502 Transcript_19763/m.48502 type:complete len:292 (-) Transcript_19763:167-1042(-)
MSPLLGEPLRRGLAALAAPFFWTAAELMCCEGMSLPILPNFPLLRMRRKALSHCLERSVMRARSRRRWFRHAFWSFFIWKVKFVSARLTELFLATSPRNVATMSVFLRIRRSFHLMTYTVKFWRRVATAAARRVDAERTYCTKREEWKSRFSTRLALSSVFCAARSARARASAPTRACVARACTSPSRRLRSITASSHSLLASSLSFSAAGAGPLTRASSAWAHSLYSSSITLLRRNTFRARFSRSRVACFSASILCSGCGGFLFLATWSTAPGARGAGGTARRAGCARRT